MKQPLRARACAHTNIALIKYWGKRDEALHLPDNDSISLTLDRFKTETELVFDPDLKEDEVIINEQRQQGEKAKRVIQFLNELRHMGQVNHYARVRSINHVPTASGLASSASGFAALAAAGNEALSLGLKAPALSVLARHGSGSAARSIFGGFVRWHAADQDVDSVALPLSINWPEVRMIVCLVDVGEKPYTSGYAMRQTRRFSPYHQAWIDTAMKDADLLQEALITHDFAQVTRIVSRNAMRMHADLLASDPPLWYIQPKTIELWQIWQQLQRQGIDVGITMDGGPHVKLLCLVQDLPLIHQALEQVLSKDRIITCAAGPGVTVQ